MKISVRSILPVLLFAFSLAASSHEVRFIPNKGQWENPVIFRADIKSGKLYLEKNAITYFLLNGEDLHRLHENQGDTDRIRGHVVRIEFEGANPGVSFEQSQKSSEYYNYFKGNDPSKWASGLYAYGRVRYKELYPGIDLEIFSQGSTIKYNFIVRPGADYKKIRMKYHGADRVSLQNGDLLIGNTVNNWKEPAPYLFQLINGKPHKVNGRFTLENNTVSFSLDAGQVVPGTDLVIDPKVVFSTFSGSLADNFGYTGTYDSLGCGYSGGTVFDPGFPVTTGAIQVIFGGGEFVSGPTGDLARDAGILKYSSNGTQLLYCTYLGGGKNEQPHSMVVNNRNELVVFGTTRSANFPVTSGVAGPLHKGNYDMYVSVFSPDGKQLMASTFLGGSGRDGTNGTLDVNYPNPCVLAYNYGDISRGEVIVDEANNIYIASCTESSDMQTVSAFQTTKGAGQDGCFIKLPRDLSTLLISTYIGGNAADAAYALALGNNNDVYISGGTASNTLLFSLTGLNKNYLGGSADGMVLKLNRNNGNLINSTYLGTNAYDQGYFVQVDKYGFPFIAGQTAGAFPVTNPVYNNPNSGQFICKLKQDLSGIERSMVFGKGTGMPDISPSAFLVDECERVFFSGWGGNTNSFPHGHGGNTTGMPKTGNAYQPNTDGSDFYLAVFSKNLDTLLYGTFFGGVRTGPGEPLPAEHVDGGTSRFDKHGIVYQSVCGGCGATSNFPIEPKPGAWSSTNNSDNCNNAFFKIDFENLNQKPVVKDTLFVLIATDSLSFMYEAYDNDKYDSLYVELTGPYITDTKNTVPPYPVIAFTKSPQHTSFRFKWKTICDHFTGDTIRLKVRAFDNSCPKADTTLATIKIIVNPPPVMPVPGKCLGFNSDNSIRITWDQVNDKYFGRYVLKRTDPSNNTVTLGTFTDPSKTSYTDKPPGDPRQLNYCYTLEVYNICNMPSPTSFQLCTKFEFDSPIDSNYLITATVEKNKDIKLVFSKSQEPDFGSYRIFRCADRNLANLSELAEVKNINDTVFIDDKVNVQDVSYCYKIMVTDQCGHLSRMSNQACNIVLKGKAEPFVHKLKWMEYTFWEYGVQNYELFRHVDTGTFSPVVLTNNSTFIHSDDKLDYDWGGYWYRVTAYETAGGYAATSVSNEVYLFQPPLLHVPNAFTPNFDKSNDIWGIVPVFVKEYHLTVYDRWGEKVFETTDKKMQWNGEYRSAQGFDNAFMWLVTFTGWDGSIHNRYGTVTILR